ncbi:hypothetical protein HZH68_016136 [Vespula germanica]|uniref:Uncharacterized protein n=1 Tax=Vespula germanica TaxID=30212 RepID=A0A834J3A0_VESGE|nr:hypothetical protein HZH68_016136 [Vespula germanica]
MCEDLLDTFVTSRQSYMEEDLNRFDNMITSNHESGIKLDKIGTSDRNGWRISYCCCYSMNNLQLCTAISLPFSPSFATRYLICLFVDDCPIRRGTVIFESISFPDLLARDDQNIAF